MNRRQTWDHYVNRVDPDRRMSDADLMEAVSAARRGDALNGQIGGLESWARTTDRRARTARGHSNSPASLDYWIRKMNADPAMAGASTEDRFKAAQNAHRAHMLRLARASAAARRAKSGRSA